MSAAVETTSRSRPTSLGELLERVPQVLQAQSPRALHLESCASTDVLETMARAEARLLKSAETFFEPLFRVSVLENLGRDDPFAEPSDEEWPDQAPDNDLESERRRLDGVTERTVLEQPHLQASVVEVEERAAHLQNRMEKLAMHVDVAAPGSSAAAPTAGDGAAASILDTVYDGVGANEEQEARRADLKNEETLRLNAEVLSTAEAKQHSLEHQAAALRADLARQQREMEFLEREQAVALASATEGEDAAVAGGSPNGPAGGRRGEASRQTENLIGVTGMSDAQLDACVQEEAAIAERNAGIRDWYAGTVANLQLLVGARVCHRLLFGVDGLEGMEFMVELGPGGKIMEVTVSAADGMLSSVQLCHSQDKEAGGGGGISTLEMEEIRRTANELPAPQNLRMVVREALGRERCAGMVEEHLRVMRRRYLVEYRATAREVTVTMGVGIVASLRLHVDYPKVAGGAEVVAVTGIGGWTPMETELLCRRVNDLAMPTLMDTIDGLETAVASLEAEKDQPYW